MKDISETHPSLKDKEEWYEHYDGGSFHVYTDDVIREFTIDKAVLRDVIMYKGYYSPELGKEIIELKEFNKLLEESE